MKKPPPPPKPPPARRIGDVNKNKTTNINMKVISNLYKILTFLTAIYFIFSGAWILSVLTIGLLIEELSKKYYKKPFLKVLLNIKK